RHQPAGRLRRLPARIRSHHPRLSGFRTPPSHGTVVRHDDHQYRHGRAGPRHPGRRSGAREPDGAAAGSHAVDALQRRLRSRITPAEASAVIGGTSMSLQAAQALAQASSLAVFATMAIWYVAPWLRTRGRAAALASLLWLHVFRYVALQTASAQHAGFPISDSG